MDEKPNLRPTRAKHKHGATMRDEYAAKGVANGKDKLQFRRFRYAPRDGAHRLSQRDEEPDPFGFLPGESYSLNKQERWDALAQLKKDTENFRRALTAEGEKRPSPDETVVVLLETDNDYRYPLCQIPFIRLNPNSSDKEEEEEEYVYKQTRKGRAVEKKDKSSRRAVHDHQDIVHEGDVIVYFWQSGKKSKKQTIIPRCRCSWCTAKYLERHMKKKVLLTEALQ
ncbi:hypothetical protein QOT17_017186 [Balamuthia mandrillaris]